MTGIVIAMVCPQKEKSIIEISVKPSVQQRLIDSLDREKGLKPEYDHDKDGSSKKGGMIHSVHFDALVRIAYCL